MLLNFYFIYFTFCSDCSLNNQYKFSNKSIRPYIKKSKDEICVFESQYNREQKQKSDLIAIKKELLPDIFHFDDTLYMKILECRKFQECRFDNNEIKILLFFGLPALEPNNNMLESIFLTLIEGSYDQIISVFLVSIRTTLIRITLQNILEEIDISLISDYLKDKQTYADFLYDNNLEKIHQFNRLIYDDSSDSFKIFLRAIFKDLFEKIRIENRNSPGYLDWFNEIYTFYYKEILEKIKLFEKSRLEGFLKLLKNYDSIIYNQSKNSMKKINYERLYMTILLLLENIPRDQDLKKFWKENEKIFFALDYLFYDFFNQIVTKFTIKIYLENGDFVLFNHELETMNKKIFCRFDKIRWLEIFHFYDLNNISEINSFMQTPKAFLDFIIKIETSIITFDNFFLKDFESNNFIRPICIIRFLNFYNELGAENYLLEISKIIRISKKEIITMKYDNDYFNKMVYFFTKYILRESYIIARNLNCFGEKDINLYQSMYSLLKIKINDDFIENAPFLYNEINHHLYTISNKIARVINNISDIRMIDCIYLENNGETVEFCEENLHYQLKKILICGKTKRIYLHTFCNIHGVINGNFYYIFLINKNYKYHIAFNNFNRLTTASALPDGKVYIATRSYLFFNFHKILRVHSGFYNNFRKIYEISYEDGCLFISNLYINIHSIPNKLKKLHFNSSIINKNSKRLNHIYLNAEYSQEKKIFLFFHCVFYTRIEMNDLSKEICLNCCTFTNAVLIINLNLIDSVKIENCIGMIILDVFRFQILKYESHKLIYFKRQKEFLIINYILLSSFILDFDVESLNISECSIHSTILIKLTKICISNCFGYFDFYMNNYNKKIGKINMERDGCIQIDTTQKPEKFRFTKIIFFEDKENFFDENPEIEVIFEDCNRIKYLEEILE